MKPLDFDFKTLNKISRCNWANIAQRHAFLIRVARASSSKTSGVHSAARILGRVTIFFFFGFFSFILLFQNANQMCCYGHQGEMNLQQPWDVATCDVKRTYPSSCFVLQTSDNHSLDDRRRCILCGFVFLLMPCSRLHNKWFDSTRSTFFLYVTFENSMQNTRNLKVNAELSKLKIKK
jgi:hypothetical protein